MHLSSAHDLVWAIKHIGKGSFLYCCNIAKHTSSSPFIEQIGHLYISKYNENTTQIIFSLLFDHRWASACCQDVSSLIIKELTSQELSLLSYINDFGSIKSTEAGVTSHFNSLHTLIGRLGLQEAAQKVHLPLQAMTFLGLRVNTISMTVTLPKEKMAESMQLVNNLNCKSHANIHELWAILRKLFYVAQCCPPARFFMNCMLNTLRACPLTGSSPLP